jgi:hypothetical protein
VLSLQHKCASIYGWVFIAARSSRNAAALYYKRIFNGLELDCSLCRACACPMEDATRLEDGKAAVHRRGGKYYARICIVKI